MSRAKELDDYYAENKKTVGPLHGLPISLKDQFRIKVSTPPHERITRRLELKLKCSQGLETTMGYVSWIGNYENDDSVLVSLLQKAGAVFHVKTSVPQSLMVCETVNNIFGRTVNPRNKNWSCGGSSGGEGAMVALRGGLIGVGTDIGESNNRIPQFGFGQFLIDSTGGSIRVPSAFNFLYGIRPSHGRLPYAKMANSMEGQETVHSVCGPLCHSISDMRLFMTSVLAEKPWMYDSKVIPMPWRQDEEDAIKSKISAGGLLLGYYDCDGIVSLL